MTKHYYRYFVSYYYHQKFGYCIVTRNQLIETDEDISGLCADIANNIKKQWILQINKLLLFPFS